MLADWPCVFLRRPPAGTSDMHSVSLWQRSYLVCPSLITLMLLSLHLSSFLQHQYILPKLLFFFKFLSKVND